MRNYSLQAISPFQTLVFKKIVKQTLTNQGLFAKGLIFLGVLSGSVVKRLTHNPGVLGSIRIGSSEFFFFFFVVVFLVKTLQSPSVILMKPRKNMNSVSCPCDMTEIQLMQLKTVDAA